MLMHQKAPQMKKSTINLIMILLGGGFLIFDLTGQNNNLILKIAALVLLMFGLYNLTQKMISDEKLESNTFSDDENK